MSSLNMKSNRQKFKRILTGFLLSVVLLVTTACDKQVSSREVDLSTGKQEAGLIYSKSQKVESLDSVDDFVSPEQQQELLDPDRIPTLQQPIINRADPDNKLLEKTKQMFDDASNF